MSIWTAEYAAKYVARSFRPVSSRNYLDDAKGINVTMMHHVDECDTSGASRKRSFVNITATRLLDDEVYDVMMDVPTRQGVRFRLYH